MKHFFLLLSFIGAVNISHGKEIIQWHSWSPELFEKAKKENRFVLLDLEALWCHWCHVMDETTYHDSRVIKLIQSKYLPVRVDQDSNLDLSNRYGDYGWPATVVFAANGSEIVKMRGYIPPEEMVSLLKAIIKDPSPGPSVLSERSIQPGSQSSLSVSQQQQLEKQHLEMFDQKFGGWGTYHKYIDAHAMDYSITKAMAKEPTHEKMALKTLDAARALIDPIWGGVYQYSDQKDWKSPHFEKIISFQAQYLRQYVEAYNLWKKPEYLQAARDILRYAREFLMSPEGAFYTSQDADLNQKMPGKIYYHLNDSQRRQNGIPTIDQNIYTRENGWMISALTKFYNVTGEMQVLEQAKKAALWIGSHRLYETRNQRLSPGGFLHGEENMGRMAEDLYLGDVLFLGQAFLDLYQSSAERDWLTKAMGCVYFIERDFKHADGGFKTSVGRRIEGALSKPVFDLDEHVALVRFGNSLSHYTGNLKFKKVAQHAMRYLTSPSLLKNRKMLTGVLLAQIELSQDPIHVTIVGSKNDSSAKALFLSALRYPAQYKRIEWWDHKEGPLPNPDVQYPQMKQAAAFACSKKTCSLPVFDPAQVVEAIDRLRPSRQS